MGFPPGSSLLPPDITGDASAADIEWLRHSLLGNAFSVHSVSYVLRGLTSVFTGQGPVPARRDFTSFIGSYEDFVSVLAQHGPSSETALPSNAAH